MLTLKKVAITGGIASGKTTVCRILKTHGACTLNSDQIIRKLLINNSSCIDETLKLLGSEILTDGKIDREKVAKIVFNNAEKLEALEKILHPKLLAAIDSECSRVNGDKNCKFFVVEIPLIQEIGQEKMFDYIIAVSAPESEARKRFTTEGFSEEMYDKRMARQWEVSKKIKNADYVINNGGTVKELENNVLEIMKELSSK